MSDAFSIADHHYMARAIQLARLGQFTSSPNPNVGCVLVKNNEIIAEGFHQKAGQPHAERVAIANAKTSTAGATAYVTLEPCCHQGRTPPCTDGLVDAGIARVVVAMQDPNPLVAGNGIKSLAEAGVEVQTGLLEQDASALNKGFIKRMTEQRPYVRCKLAMSLDGRTAMENGESQWITGRAARKEVQQLRAASSAIVTGIGTVLADDPSLNVRIKPAEANDFIRQPLRVVLDSQARMPLGAKMLSLPGDTRIYCATCSDETNRDRLLRSGAQVKVIEATEQGLSLNAVLEDLARSEINDVLLECGATLAGAALQAGLVDELIVYMAPCLMGDTARGLVSIPGLEHMNERIQLKLSDISQIGGDIKLVLRKS